MEFNSLFFIFIYMPLFIGCLFFIKNNKIRNIIIILFSLLFYLSGEKKYFFIIIAISLITYFTARNVKNNKFVYCLFLILIIGTLSIFKYHITLANIFKNLSLGAMFSDFVMPLGISFYTFTSISYVSDVYYEKYEYEENYFKILSFLTFFPVVISGPLIRYNDYKNFLDQKNITCENVSNGLRRFIIGLSKKMIIANQAAIVVSKLFVPDIKLSFTLAWYALVAYAIQSYYDFSGYSDMAIGIGQMIGYKMPENFNNPYFSHSVAEYWRRWHMTLGSWFKDYVFIPVLGSKSLQSISKKFENKTIGRTISKVLALLLVWILTGIWHGATINYIFWGLFNGAFIISEVIFSKKYKQIKTHLRINENSKLWKVFQIIRTNFILTFKNILAKCITLPQIKYFIACICGIKGFLDITYVRQLNVLYVLVYIVVGLIFLFPCIHKFFKTFGEKHQFAYDSLMIVLLFVSVCYIVSGSYSAFIYFNF